MDQLLDKMKRPLLAKVNIGYFDGELKKLVVKAGGQSSLQGVADTFIPHILIISRGYYQEKLVSYPLTNKKELNKLLSLQSAESNEVSAVNLIEDNQTWVNKWQFNASVPKARIMLPESVILADSNRDAKDIVVLNDKGQTQLFVATSVRGLYSAAPSRLMASRLLFCQSSGLPFDETFCEIRHGDFAQWLMLGLIRLTFKNWHTFANTTIAPMDLKSMQRPALTSAIVAVAYLALTSVYIGFSQWQVERQLANGSDELRQALQLETQVSELRDTLDLYQSVTQDFSVASPVWQLLLPLFEQASFTQIQLVNHRFILRGQTQKATDILSLLTKMPNVQDATFDLPVSKNRLQERFTISFTLQNTKPQVP